MDFLFGAIIATIIFLGALKYLDSLSDIARDTPRYRFSQSSMHEIIKPLLPKELFERERPVTQSFLHEERTNLRVIILDGIAYWIKDNKFYEADMLHDGIDKDNARVVDTMGMNKVQLDKMLFIMDRLREGLDNDSGSTGDK